MIWTWDLPDYIREKDALVATSASTPRRELTLSCLYLKVLSFLPRTCDCVSIFSIVLVVILVSVIAMIAALGGGVYYYKKKQEQGPSNVRNNVSEKKDQTVEA